MARNRSRRSRRGATTAESIRGWAIALISVAAFVFVGWQAYLQISGRPDLGDDLCPGTGEASLTAVLVDLTDPLTVAQRQDFLNQLERVRNEVPKFGRLTLYKVDATKEKLLAPVLDLCNPGDGSDVTEATGNPKKVKETWNEKFSQPVEKAFEELTQESGSAESPIFQSVQSVTLTKLQRPNVAGKPKKLILVSDLLQHSGDLNFYQRVPTLDELRRSKTYAVSLSDLSGVQTEIWMLTRSNTANTQIRKLAVLWMEAFKDQHAAHVTAHNING